MRFRNRDIPVHGLPGKGLAFVRALPGLARVRNPLGVLGHYLRQTSPDRVVLRSGLEIRLSGHPHDIITFFVVFLRRDYGRIRPGAVVVDVGANIGVFALYAASQGAERVVALEPCEEAYQTLCANVELNGLGGVIEPRHCLVDSIHGREVPFPVSSSPYNRVGREGAGECRPVTSVRLDTLARDLGLGSIDVLKMDCEGCEFTVLPGLDPGLLARIHEIRLECHGPPDGLIQELAVYGFAATKNRPPDLWLARSRQPVSAAA